MSNDTDLADQLIDGTTYEKAEVLVTQSVPVSVTNQVRICILTLFAAGLLGPTINYRLDLITTLEATAEPFSLSIGTLTFMGILPTFIAGLLLVHHYWVVHNSSFTLEEAKGAVRRRNLLLLFVALGSTFVTIAVTLAVLGVVSSGAVQTLYENGIRVYRPGGGMIGDVRFVSVTGWILATVLFTTWEYVRIECGYQ